MSQQNTVEGDSMYVEGLGGINGHFWANAATLRLAGKISQVTADDRGASQTRACSHFARYAGRYLISLI